MKTGLSIPEPAAFPPADPPFATLSHDAVLARIREILGSHRPIVLATVDASGAPRAGWIAAISLRGFPILHAAMPPTHRTLENIREHPRVTWFLSNNELTATLAISGCAEEIIDPYAARDVWKAVGEECRAWFLTAHPRLSVVRASAEDAELCLPRENLQVPVAIEDLRSILGVGEG